MITSTLRLGKKVSLVLWLIDQYTGLGCNEGDVSVYLNGRLEAFQRKAGGYLVFTDLTGEVCQIRVEVAHYLSEEFAVDLKAIIPNGRVVYVPLIPAPDYPFSTSATLLRASVAPSGQPAVLTATLLSDNCARAKLGRQGATAGSNELPLVDVTMRSAPGDLFIIRPQGSEKGELCEVANPGIGEGVYGLKASLNADHERGEFLLPVVRTRADERGEAVLAFRNFRQRECQISLELSKGNLSDCREVTIQLGMTYNLGHIASSD